MARSHPANPRTLPRLWARVVAFAATLMLLGVAHAHAQLYWNTNGTNATWTGSVWGTAASGPYTNAWVVSTNVIFGVSSTGTNLATFATATVGDVTVNADTTITSGGTLTSKSGGSTVNVADGVTLTWSSQNRSTTGANNIWTKNGDGTWIINAGTTSGDPSVGSSFTLNAGTVSITGARALGGPNSILNINGGLLTIGTVTSIGNSTINIGGDFGLAGTATTAFTGNVSLGSATRTITNTATGGRTFSGNISASSAYAGLTFAGTGTTTLSGTSTYTGKTTLNSGTLLLTNESSAGATTSDLEVAGGLLNLGNASRTNAAFTLSGGTITNGTLQATNYALQGGTVHAILGAGAITVSSGTTTLGSAGRLNTAATLEVNSGQLSLGGAETVAALSGSGGTVALGSHALTFGGNNANTTYSGTITGTGGALTKSGTGTLTLGGNNTYTGATAISNGAVRITHANALGTTAAGTTVSSGAALELSGGITTAAEALSLTGTGISTAGALRNISGNNTFAGAISLAGATRINADDGTLTLSGGISGAQNLTIGGAGNTTVSSVIGTSTGTLTKDGAGTLTLSGANTYTGGTLISAGTLRLGAGAGTGSLSSTGEITNNAALIVDRTGSLTLSNVISGTGSLTKAGNGTLVLSGNNTYSGTTTISEGFVRMNSSGTAIGGNVVIAGGTLDYATGSANDQIATGAALTMSSGAFELGARSQTLASMTMSGGALTRGGGTLTLSGASSFTGGTVTLGAGTSRIQTTGETTFGAVTFSYTSVAANDFALVLGGNVVTTGSGTTIFENTTNGTPFINLGGATRTFDIISGTDMQVGWGLRVGGITKTGEGTLVLSAASTYSSTTTLSEGTLVIGDQNALGTGNFVQSSGTLLQVATTGTITNTMSIFNVSFTESVTLTGAKTLNNATIDVATGETVTEQGVLSGTGGLIKVGGGAYILNGSANNTYTGATEVSEGSLVLSNSSGNAIHSSSGITVNSGGTLVLGASNQIGDGIGLTLNGGTFLVGALNVTEKLGTLTLSASSTIDFGDYGNNGLRQVTFGDSSAISWANNVVLTIANWQGVAASQSEFTKLVFGGEEGLNSEQRGQIQFAGYEQGSVLVEGELAPIPEAPVVWGAVAVTGFIFWRERRRLLGLFGRGLGKKG